MTNRVEKKTANKIKTPIWHILEASRWYLVLRGIEDRLADHRCPCDGLLEIFQRQALEAAFHKWLRETWPAQVEAEIAMLVEAADDWDNLKGPKGKRAFLEELITNSLPDEAVLPSRGRPRSIFVTEKHKQLAAEFLDHVRNVGGGHTYQRLRSQFVTLFSFDGEVEVEPDHCMPPLFDDPDLGRPSRRARSEPLQLQDFRFNHQDVLDSNRSLRPLFYDACVLAYEPVDHALAAASEARGLSQARFEDQRATFASEIIANIIGASTNRVQHDDELPSAADLETVEPAFAATARLQAFIDRIIDVAADMKNATEDIKGEKRMKLDPIFQQWHEQQT